MGNLFRVHFTICFYYRRNFIDSLFSFFLLDFFLFRYNSFFIYFLGLCY